MPAEARRFPTRIAHQARLLMTDWAKVAFRARKKTSKQAKRATNAQTNAGSRSAAAIRIAQRMPKATKASPWRTV